MIIGEMPNGHVRIGYQGALEAVAREVFPHFAPGFIDVGGGEGKSLNPTRVPWRFYGAAAPRKSGGAD
jgi:hypothetical protein